MKMQLLGTTAIVGASLLFAAPAAADKHEKKPTVEDRVGGLERGTVTHAGKGTKVTLTGGFDFQAGFVDQDQEGGGDLGAPDRGYGFITNSEIAVKASGFTDAGMKWSAKVEIETDTDSASTTDELQLTLSGSWGALVMGNEDGPEDLMDYGADQVLGGVASGGVSGDWKDFTNTVTGDAVAAILGLGSRLMLEATLGGDAIGVDSSDATKIVYYTPRINGLQLGVGYVPDTGASGDKTSSDDDDDAETFFGLGINYVKKFDGFDIAIGAVGSFADAEFPGTPGADATIKIIGFNQDTDAGSTVIATVKAVAAVAGDEDVAAWRVGAVLGFGAFKIGGGYQDVGDSLKESGTDGDATQWDIGISWSQGPVAAGVGYLHSEVETADGDDELDVVTLGATYTLGKGLVVYADVWWLSTDDATADSTTDNDAYGLLIGTTVSF